ncbi:type VI secretion system protein TssA [Microbulbifer agarilyticus]
MAFSNFIEISALLEDLPGDRAHGEDIREDRSPTSDYYTIKDARNSARAAERSAMFDDGDTDLLAPWRDVAATAESILRNKSKDLEVASWYTEALIRLHGFTGLRDGILLLDGLARKFWDVIYPEPDEDGIETKVAPLTGLNGDGADGTLLLPIRSADITPESDFGGFSFFQFQQARDADKIVDPDAQAARIETLGYELSEFENCTNTAEPVWARDLVETLEETTSVYKELNTFLREKCGQDTPPFSNISSLLDEVLRTTRFIYADKLQSLQADPETQSSEVAADKQGSSQVAVAIAPPQTAVQNGPVASREDALLLLEQAARYFRTYEPHTPLAPGLERLIGWGRMTVAELMTELLPDDQSRAIYSQLTGVLLDGSDGQRYVAPPVGAPHSPTSPPSSEPPASDSNTDGGWSEEAKEEAVTSHEPSW